MKFEGGRASVRSERRIEDSYHAEMDSGEERVCSVISADKSQIFELKGKTCVALLTRGTTSSGEVKEREREVSIRATQICSRAVGGVRSVPKDFTIWFAIARTSSAGESVRSSRRR